MNERLSIQQRLATQRALIGFLQAHPNLTLTEMVGVCGYDFLLLDGEHGVFSEQDYLRALQVLAATNALAMVRVAKHDAEAIGRYLDMGADVIVVPKVSTAEEARTLARAMEYPPRGTRGFGASIHRATRYGLELDAHLMAPRKAVYLVAIIESVLGVSNAEDIVAVEGVDGVIIGPWDLSTDLGHAGEFFHPDYAQAVGCIEQAARGRGKILGTAPHPGHPIEALVGRGHRLLIVDDDVSLIREAMTAQVAKSRAETLGK
jgi:2-keto-3-deoxy-L-rhamnonate aldolase RhmA